MSGTGNGGAAVGERPDVESTPRRNIAALLSNPIMLLVVLLLAMIVVFGSLNPVFLSLGNLLNILVQSLFILLLAAGLTFVMVAGHIDLSVGTVLGFTAGLSIFVLINGGGVVLAVVVPIAVGMLFGLFNGLLVARLQASDFIVTLGTLALAAGALRVLDARQPLRGVESSTYLAISHGQFLGLPLPVLLAGLVVATLAFVLSKTAFGRLVFAVGTSRAAARLSGVRVERVQIAVFALSGAMAGFSGLLLASRLGAVPAGLGEGFELQAIAAAVLGGTSLAGGHGNIAGSILGALMLTVLRNGLQFIGVDPAWFQIVVGASIVGAMLVNQRLQYGLRLRFFSGSRAPGA
jgi:ribose transport system permease protein